MKVPRIILAGTHSGVGKTTITSGLMRALTLKGQKVQGFKVGPDYIDPSYHSLATGEFSRNIDTWLLSKEKVLELVRRNIENCDLAVIEGVMGFFDGFRGNSDLGNTAHIAKITKSPVILIVDTKSMARSIAALVYGFANYDPEVNIAGLILNKVASERHLEILKQALEPLGIPVIGHIFRDEKLGMPERHLGLIPAGEMEGLLAKMDLIAENLSNNISLNKLLQIANSAEDFPEIDINIFNMQDKDLFKNIKIAYAFDKAFSFYYRDALDMLNFYGVELVPFSPLNDKELPEGISGIIIGGGFPELFLKELSDNIEMLNSIREFANNGIPILAECGGFMYLCEEITDFQEKSHKLVGLIPGKTIMTKKLKGMGYREAELLNDCILGKKGEFIKGHEFHYSYFQGAADNMPWALNLNNGKIDGYAKENIFASYLHLHFASNPKIAMFFLNKCKKFNNDFEVKK